MATQAQIALSITQQLRLLDPSISAEVGTPERKIIDTVAQELANAQIDLAQLDGALDLDSKFGADLDNFISIFGFARQQGAQSTGYVKFSRTVASDYIIPIARNTQVAAASVGIDGGSTVGLIFATTVYTEIPAGQLSAIAPIRCLTTGSVANVAANVINSFARTPIPGITSVTNEVPTTNGIDQETDAELKVRFKNTVFRNLAGTLDQYLALAVATQFTTKANVVGPISRYREYIQIPDKDDATADPDSGITGNGAAGEWTSALSSIPYSKHVYDSLPYFVTNGDTSANSVFYRRDVDFLLNTTDAARDKGDTYRGRIGGSGLNVNTDSGTDFQPNLRFFNVYEGADTTVTALRPKDVVLFEHSYMSDASRNDYDRRILNCVDVYINGQNSTLADAITVKPDANFVSINQFVTNSSSRYYFENFRRVGEPNRRPIPGNFFLGLFWAPITDVPNTIVTANATYIKDVHYWAIEDVSDIGRSVRARTGIEWNPTVKGRVSADNESGPFTGSTIVSDSATALEIIGYSYDRNIVDLQTSLEANKQVTTDVLAHQSSTRYFKLDITVMYTQGSSISSVNDQIRAAVVDFLDGQYFGTTVQLSDLLQVIHSIGGVDNVRWSRDITENLGTFPNDVDTSGNPRHRVVECDSSGEPLCNLIFDRRTYGHASAAEVQVGYLTGNPTSGTFKIKYQASQTTAIAYNATSGTITTALGVAGIPATVSGTGTPANPFVFTFTSNGSRDFLTISSNALRGTTSISNSTVFDSDFFLKDNQLPALPDEALSSDTLAGLIIRPRAQNTWNNL